MNDDQNRFRYHLENDGSMRFFLRNAEWRELRCFEVTDEMILSSTSGIVSYPSGEAMFMYGLMHDVPDGVSFNTGACYSDSSPGYSKSLMKEGAAKVKVTHGDSLSQGKDPRSHYSTSVTNLSDRKIRAVKFAAYKKGLFGRLSRESDGFYSPRQFREWFRVPDPYGWILPNETVCDPDNFGYGNGYWLYFFEDDLERFFIGSGTLGRRARNTNP